MDTPNESVITEAAWTAIVGEEIAACSRARALVGRHQDTLLIEVKSAAWAQQIGFLNARIVRELRGRGIAVNHLRLRVAPQNVRNARA